MSEKFEFLICFVEERTSQENKESEKNEQKGGNFDFNPNPEMHILSLGFLFSIPSTLVLHASSFFVR